LQAKLYSFQFNNQKMIVEDYTDEEVYSHLGMLLESPFVGGRRFLSGEFEIKELTWNGREFLDAIRGDDIWIKTKVAADKIGEVGIGFVWEITKGGIKHELKTRLGIDAA
jgi:hypothetical protein